MLIYRIISIFLFPLLLVYIFIRAFKGKEDVLRLHERFGIASKKRFDGDIIWIHAASVGEANSALVLVDEILQSSVKTSVLFTTTTLTSAAILANKIKDCDGRLIHQFMPIDSYFIVKKFLAFWCPKKIFFVESEIWPNFIYEAWCVKTPIILVNARMSEKSFTRWAFAREFGFRIFDYFKMIFVQSEDDHRRYSQLSRADVLFYGNLKLQAANIKYDHDELQKIKDQINSRKFWLAASTHAGEEEIIFATHKKLKEKFTDLLTIIVPRHPNRALDIIKSQPDLCFSRRSLGQAINEKTEIYLADTLGDLGLFYALSDFAFIAGSLKDIGGHNPYEAIKLNCAVISGKYFVNFKEIYQKLSEHNCCVIAEENNLYEFVKDFLQNPQLAQNQAKRAFDLIINDDNIAKKIIDKFSTN